jgi:hypothetical protein
VRHLSLFALLVLLLASGDARADDAVDAKAQLKAATLLNRDGRFEEAHAAVEKVAAMSPDKATAKAANDLAAALEAKLGIIIVVAEPEGATVSVDGVVVGTTPLPRRIYKVPGPHVVRLEKAGYVAAEQNVEVQVNGTPPVTTTLAPAAVAVVIRAEPPVPDAVAIVDGEKRGPLPWSSTLAPGRHQLDAESATFTFEHRTIEIAPSAAPLDDIVLSAKARSVKLRIATRPMNASIWIDRVPRGVGTVDVELPLGPHVVRAEVNGYEPEERTIDGLSDEYVSIALEASRPRVVDKPVEAPSRSPSHTYAELSAVGLFTAAADPIVACDRPEVASCAGGGGPHGGGFDPHFGYNFGNGRDGFGLDVEAMLLSIAGGVHRDVALRKSTDSLSFLSPFAVAGAGPRYTTSGESFRATFAVDLLAALRAYIDSSHTVPVGNARIVPAMSISAGGILGRDSGSHLAFGVRSFLELPHESELARTDKGTPVTFGSTTTFTVGPYVGVQFGQ